MNYKQFQIVTLLLVALIGFHISCAEVQKSAVSMGTLFQGNTKKDIVDYDLKDKSEYRKYHYMKKIEEKEKEEEILMFLDPSQSPNNTTNNPIVKSDQPKEKKNIFQKIFKK